MNWKKDFGSLVPKTVLASTNIEHKEVYDILRKIHTNNERINRGYTGGETIMAAHGGRLIAIKGYNIIMPIETNGIYKWEGYDNKFVNITTAVSFIENEGFKIYIDK